MPVDRPSRPTLLPLAGAERPLPDPGPAPFEKIAVIGLGLIGGWLPLRGRGPPGAVPAAVPGEAIVTDTGSTKRAMMAAAANLPARFTFIGGHPLGGAARGGIDAARGDLFLGRPWLLTPREKTPAPALARVEAFVRALGATPRAISADAHDRLLAFLSHLPQLTASALMQVVGEAAGEDGLALSGRGLRDTTRLAASPPAIWRDICRTNAGEIGPALDALIGVLGDLRADLEGADTIDRVFRSAAAWRSRLPVD